MSVFTMCSKDTPGAYPITHYAAPGQELFMVETYKGLVLNEYERNGYNDSDFYVTVWDEENNRPKTFQYATTRAWTYPNNAVVDATEEIVEKFKAWQKREHRRYAASKNLAAWKQRSERAEMTGLEVRDIRRLERRLGNPESVKKCIGLLRTRHANRFRSNFRRNLAEQLYTWLMDKNPKYRSPFSMKQWMYI